MTKLGFIEFVGCWLLLVYLWQTSAKFSKIFPFDMGLNLARNNNLILAIRGKQV